MIKIFVTNIGDRKNASRVISVLKEHYEDFKITVDTEDCDNIMRVEADLAFTADSIMDHVAIIGFEAEEIF